jgi:hypothetical protein
MFLLFGVGELRATEKIHEPADGFPAGCGWLGSGVVR